MSRRGAPVRTVGGRRTPVGWCTRLLALLVVATATTALAAPHARGAPAVSTERDAVVITTDDGGTGSAPLAMTINAPVAGTLRLAVEDAVLEDGERWVPRSAGTTPYTLDERLRAQPAELRYEGSDVGARVTHVVSLQVDTTDGEVPRVGLVTVAFEPDVDGADAPAPARVRIAAWPADLDSPPVAVAQRDVTASTASRWSVLDRLRASLPRVIGHGELTLAATTVNTGDAAVATRTTLELTRTGPPGVSWGADDDPLLTVADTERVLFPDESHALRTRHRDVEGLPALGFVRVEATTTAMLGAQEVVQTRGRTYLVVPWQQASVVALLLVGVLAWRVREHRRREVPEPTATRPTDADPVTAAPAPAQPQPARPPATAPRGDEQPAEPPWGIGPFTVDPILADPSARADDPHADASDAEAAEAPHAEPPAAEPPDAEPTDAEAKRIVAEILARIEADRAAAREADASGTTSAQREPGTW